MRRLLLGPWLALVACDGSVDLPAGWEHAVPTAGVTQTECAGSPFDPGLAPRIDVTASPGQIHVAYLDAVYRCQQDVEAFVRTDATNVDVLVQPIDMHPSNVPKCSCVYGIETTIERVAPGEHLVAVYSRQDSYGGEQPVTFVASDLVVVP